MTCSCALPLLSSLTKQMTVYDEEDPGYIARFKAASVNDFSEHVADMKSIEILKCVKHPCTCIDTKMSLYALGIGALIYICIYINIYIYIKYIVKKT